MQTKFIEAVSTLNWGKFMIGRFTDEWNERSKVDDQPLIRSRGWGPDHLLVLDLQTGESALFPVRAQGWASADLNTKHQIWVCPLFEPFLNWLYQQDVSDLDALPSVVELPDAPPAMYGYRRTRTDA